MSQYRLWLQHREIDQSLQTQLKALVKELTRVDEQISLLASTTLQVDNVIIQALLKEFQVEVSSVPIPAVPIQAISPDIPSSPTSGSAFANAMGVQNQQPIGSVSSSPFIWGNLPSFASQDLHNSTRQTALPAERVASTPLPTQNPVHPDIRAFVEAHKPTLPQTKSSWRFPTLTRPSHSMPDDSSPSPVDQESIRVNQVVKRWFERRTRFTQETVRNLEEQKERVV